MRLQSEEMADFIPFDVTGFRPLQPLDARLIWLGGTFFATSLRLGQWKQLVEDGIPTLALMISFQTYRRYVTRLGLRLDTVSCRKLTPRDKSHDSRDPARAIAL